MLSPNPEMMKTEILKSGRLDALTPHIHDFGASELFSLFKSLFPGSWRERIKSWEHLRLYKNPQEYSSKVVVWDNKHIYGKRAEEIFRRAIGLVK